jgi:nucleotide-binding universal stress UspA family protein
LLLVHVLPEPRQDKASRSRGLSIAETIHRLQELVPPEAEFWCRPDVMVQHGEPAEQILATAHQHGADLIVLGVRGMDGLSAMSTHLTRAIAYKVVVQAPCPVLTVRS